jgi:hypothetical protein
MISWLRTHRFEAHLISFGLMILVSVGLYITVNTGLKGLTWVLLGVFALANVLAMAIK